MKKYRKRFNARLIKAKRTYSIEEIAEVLHVHPNSVNVWLKNGLEKIDAHHPYLILGSVLIDFLNVRNRVSKKPCAENELFCCKCKKPQQPRDKKVRIINTQYRTNMSGICNVCGTCMNKLISPSKLDLYKNIFIVEVHDVENL